MNGHVFVSHGSDDRVQANELAAFIEAKGAKAWIAPRNVRPGQDYSEQLQEAIENCSAFMVLVTDKANKSPYVRAEVEMAFSLFKPIFPVRLSDIKPAAGLALFLKIRHWTDAFGPDREANLARLAREVQTAAGVAVDPTEVVYQAEARAAAARSAEAPAIAVPPAPPPPPPPPSPSPPAVSLQPVSPPPAAPPPAYRAHQPPQAAAPMTVPTAPTVALAANSVPADPALLRAAVGANSDYYLDRWAKMDAKGGATSWNWPACLLNMLWFAYRKMWLPMAGVFVASVALAMIAASNPDFGRISWLFSIGITFVTGMFGNHLYRQHIEKLIEDTAPLGRPAQLEALARRGGVSMLAVVFVAAAAVAAAVLSFLANTGWTARVAPVDNRPAPVERNQPDPVVPPPGGIPGYDGAPPAGEQPKQPQQPRQPQNPPEIDQQDPGQGEEMPIEDERSFGEDEARQDEISQPE